jgi:hypothetical protein
VERLVALAVEDDWKLRPDPHVAFWQAPVGQRWYTHCQLSPADYMRQWITDLPRAGRTVSRNDLEDETLFRWLIDRGYAQPSDRPGLERLLETRRDRLDMRPSIEVSRGWPWQTARELDGDGRNSRLVAEVREALERVLAILDEPDLASLSEG